MSSSPPPAKRAKNKGNRGDLGRAALYNRLSTWLDENDEESKAPEPPMDTYGALTSYVCTLLRDHPNQDDAKYAAAEISKIATKLLAGTLRGDD